MGYSTRHMLSIISEPNNDNLTRTEDLKKLISSSTNFTKIKEMVEEINELEHYDLSEEVISYIILHEEINYAIENLDEFGEETKWYSHENDMRKLSNKFRDVLFELEGEGEESGDMWKEYYKNGKMQRCNAEFVFPEYNELELK